MGYMPESDAFIAGMTAVRFVRLMGELSGLPAGARARARPRGAFLRRARRGPLPQGRDLLARHEAARQARPGDRARAAAPLPRRADQRPRPLRPRAHAPADPRHPRHRRGQPHPLLAPAARRRGVLRRGAGPEGRRRRRLLQPRRGAAGQPQVPGARDPRRRRGARSPPPSRPSAARSRRAPRQRSSWCCRKGSRCATSTGSPPSGRCRSAGSTTSRIPCRTSSSRPWRRRRTPMAVYERNYGRYEGALTPTWSRFLILPRYAFEGRLRQPALRASSPSASCCRSPGC